MWWLIGLLSGLSFMSLLIINDYFNRKKLTENVKVGDRRRIFTENETTFDRVEVIEIFENEKGKRIAKCKHKNGDIETISASDLIY